jgi:hypothetical protein
MKSPAGAFSAAWLIEFQRWKIVKESKSNQNVQCSPQTDVSGHRSVFDRAFKSHALQL